MAPAGFEPPGENFDGSGNSLTVTLESEHGALLN